MRIPKGYIRSGLLAVGIGMLCYGVMRGEAAIVLAKAIKICLECVGIG